MDDDLDTLIERERRLRIYTAWLSRTLEGSVNPSAWTLGLLSSLTLRYNRHIRQDDDVEV